MVTLLKLPEFPLIHFSKRNDVVERLVEIIDVYAHNTKVYKEENERLKGIIAELQNAPKKPKIKPSSVEKPSSKKVPRKHKQKKSKIDRLVIHEHRILRPSEIPSGSIFKGYRTYFVQDIELKSYNTLFKIERWQLPDGSYLSVSIPNAYKGFHFGPQLRTFILQQYYQARVTRPKLLQQLQSWGIEISSGEIDFILTTYTDSIDKELSLAAHIGIENSSYIQTDDTGARHAGKNHVCTQIGNHLFTYFNTSTSKSRLNFLELLNKQQHYTINKACIEYLQQHSSMQLIKTLAKHEGRNFSREEVETFLKENVCGKHQKRRVLEALNIGFLVKHLGENFVVLSDGAPQYAVLNHAGCWVHALRLLEKEYPICKGKSEKIVQKLRRIYHHLKRYKKTPSLLFRKRLETYFDLVCDLKTGSKGFDNALQRFCLNKQDLLRVLEAPEIPLHNNMSENDLREYVVRRKISGGTRSDLGKRSRDVFCSLLKTCLKLEIKFWDFLEDYIYRRQTYSLAEQIMQKLTCLT